MKRHTFILGLAMAGLGLLAGCGSSDSNPTSPFGGGGTYDGLWQTSLALPAGYPVSGLSFEVINDEFVGAQASYFFDLLQCAKTYTDVPFTPAPPAGISNGYFSAPVMSNGAITIVGLDVTFLSPSQAKGQLMVTYGSGATCVFPPAGTGNMPIPFTATKVTP